MPIRRIRSASARAPPASPRRDRWWARPATPGWRASRAAWQGQHARAPGRQRPDWVTVPARVERESLEVASNFQGMTQNVDARAVARNVVGDRQGIVELASLLVEVGDRRVLTDGQLATGRWDLANQRPKQRS